MEQTQLWSLLSLSCSLFCAIASYYLEDHSCCLLFFFRASLLVSLTIAPNSCFPILIHSHLQSQIGALICAQSRNSDTVCQPPMEWEPGVHTVPYLVSVCPVFPYPRHLPEACSHLQAAPSSFRITEGPSPYLIPTPVTSILVCSFCLSSLIPI